MEERFQEFKKELKDWRLTVPLLIALMGLGVGGWGTVDFKMINTPEKVRINTEQLIPGYDPVKFEAEQKIVQGSNAEINRDIYNKGQAAERTVYQRQGYMIGFGAIELGFGAIALEFLYFNRALRKKPNLAKSV